MALVDENPVMAVREDLFNEIIYGLGILRDTFKQLDDKRLPGAEVALIYVKCMKEAEFS
jgi:hypothetical protein